MVRIAACALIGFLTLPAPAQDSKWKPPTIPAGWKSMSGKGGRFQFAIPSDARSSGTRELNQEFGGIKSEIHVSYAMLKDGTNLEVRESSISGAPIQGMSESEIIGLFIDVEKDHGFKASGPKEVAIGEIKAREYRLSSDKLSRRLVMFGVKPRIFALEVFAVDAAKLDSQAANTFLSSFVLVPTDVIEAAAKERAEKLKAAGAEHVAKFGAKWTDNLGEMAAPDVPATGLVRGQEFKPDSVTLQRGGRLQFRQGTGTFPDAEVELWLILKRDETVENKTYEVGKGLKPPVTPHVRLSTKPEGAPVPTSESFVSNYSLKLSFGAKDSTGAIPGTIYLCTPDGTRSFLAGKFTAAVK